MADASSPSETVHATTVSLNGRGALILGSSGAGKSALALQLNTLGATLVSDDRTILTRRTAGRLTAHAPDAIRGMIEARGVGILNVDWIQSAEVSFVVDLEQEETERLPPPRTCEVLGVTIPCLYQVSLPHFPASILLCLKGRLPVRT